MNNRQVEIYVRGSTYYHLPEKSGYYEALITDIITNRSKLLQKPVDGHTTPNRLMINGAIDAIRSLKYPCNITVYAPTSLGFPRCKGANRDILLEMRDVADVGGHTIVHKANSELVRNKFKEATKG